MFVRSLLCVVSACCLCFSAFAETVSIKWPGKAKVAISLSYDDALNSQLDYAIPTLNRYGIKASFYPILTSPDLAARMDEWKQVPKMGHELGNHTVFHACSRATPDRSWVPVDNDLSKKTVNQMLVELNTANTFLHLMDGQTERTLTPPCLDHEAEDGNYIDAAKEMFIGIKGAEDLPEDFVSIYMPQDVSGKELINHVKKAAKKGGLVNIIFHGINGDHIVVSQEAHEEFIRFLSRNRDVYWTDTYRNIMKHVNEQRASTKK